MITGISGVYAKAGSEAFWCVVDEVPMLFMQTVRQLQPEDLARLNREGLVWTPGGDTDPKGTVGPVGP